MKFFIVGVDAGATKAQRDAFTVFLRDEIAGVGFWHDVTHTWLIRDGSQSLTSTKLRDKLGELMPAVSVVVVEAEPADYAAFSVKTGHEWLEKYVLIPGPR